MFSYLAYGLRIDSFVELPELSPAPPHSASDIIFRGHPVEPQNPREKISGPAIAATSREISISYPNVVSLHITDGKLVDVDLQPDIDPAILRLILLGPILALVLHQRGYLVLHASAVEINSSAIAFIGDKGAGKSTTAAAFSAQGFPIFSDDVVAVAPESHLVYPGFPQLKLWREAAQHLADNPENLHRVDPNLDKLAVPVSDRFAQSPRPLRRIYALADGPEVEIRPLPPQQTFMELIKNSYTLSLLQPTGSAESHFRHAVALAAQVPVRHLLRPRALPLLPNLVASVVADAR